MLFLTHYPTSYRNVFYLVDHSQLWSKKGWEANIKHKNKPIGSYFTAFNFVLYLPKIFKISLMIMSGF